MKTFLLICVMLLTANINAQIVVKETVQDSVVWQNKKLPLPKLIVFYTEEKSDYTFYFKNEKYKTISDIKYLSLGNKQTAIDFFTLIKTVGESDKKITIELSGDIWIIDKINQHTVQIWNSSQFFYMNLEENALILKSLSK